MKSDDILTRAQACLLEPGGISNSQIVQVLDSLCAHEIDTGELYFQHVLSESFSLEDGIIKEGSFSIDQGVGVRAISGDKTGLAYSDEIAFEALMQAAIASRSISRSSKSHKPLSVSSLNPHKTKAIYTTSSPLDSLSAEQKIHLLKSIDQKIRQEEPSVSQVNVSLMGSYETILVCDTHGTYAADIRPLVRLSISVILEKNGIKESASSGGGGRYGYDQFLKDNLMDSYAMEAVRQARVRLEAIEAPAGAMQVVLGPGWPGVMLHEAVGHGLEGDFNRKKSSTYSGRIGEKVASSLCTVIDDGTLDSRRGSLSIDDEGTPTAHNVLIENGILKGYMQDKLNARLMGLKPTGNGRRESYAHNTMPRMTNTFMLAGNHTHEEIIASVKNGIYCANFGGGSVDITSGKFVFSTSEAYLIENGKITQPVKGATLIGNGPDVMQKVSMVGNNLKLDEGVGTCGKDGQSVPVGIGQPTLKIDEITVGGTRGA